MSGQQENNRNYAIARTISMLRLLHRKRGTPMWGEIHERAVKSFDGDDAVQELLLEILADNRNRGTIVEPIYNILDDANIFSIKSLYTLKRLYLTVPSGYLYVSSLVRVIGYAAAANSRGEEVIQHVTNKCWQDELRFCEPILSKYRRFRKYSPGVALAVWQHLLKLHIRAKDEDASRTWDTINSYRKMIDNLKIELADGRQGVDKAEGPLVE